MSTDNDVDVVMTYHRKVGFQVDMLSNAGVVYKLD
jgi:hypothetical protein